jgi:NhaP-type Na+/H+ or K+/H+ antiporter
VKRLVFPAVPIAWVLGSAAAHYVGGLSFPVAIVVGAILVVTGPTVIMPLLRHARLRKGPASLLKWEGIVNDPIGALLAVLVFQWLKYEGTGTPAEEIGLGVFLTIVASVALGWGGGVLLAKAFRRAWVPEFLKSPVLLGSALAVYVLADLAQEEAGLAAVTVFGLVLGNQRLPSIDQLRRFKEYIVVVLVSSVFILLSADLDPHGLANLGWRAWVFVAAVVFVVRPATIFLSTAGAGLAFRERLLVGWIAPRGVVAAAVTAAFVPEAVPLVFLIIIVTVTLHGLSIRPLARRLGLAAPSADGVLIVGSSPFGVELAGELSAAGVTVMVADRSWRRLRRARMASVPNHYGEVLSEVSEETLDLSEIGTVLAMTGNDAYNALVCSQFAAELGHGQVYQLAISSSDEDDPRGYHHSIRGSTLFTEDAGFAGLMRRHYRGFAFRRTTLTETYDEAAFRASLPEDALWIAMVRKNGVPVFKTGAEDVAPGPGDTVLVYGPPEGESG